MATQPANPNQGLFSSLAAKFGVPVALQLVALINPQANAASKAFSGANLAGTGAKIAGGLSGSPALAGIGQGLGAAAGVAGAGYGAYRAATDPNLNRTQQIGHSGRSVADAAMSLLIPYYGLAKAASVVGQQLQRSGSPQIRGTGRAIDQVAEPSGAKAFWDVAQGDLSPRAAASRYGWAGAMTDTMGPIGAILKGVGVKLPFLSHTPTTGTSFRGELDRLFNQVPALKGTPTSNYNIDPDLYSGFDQTTKDTASMLGTKLSALTPSASKNPQAYANQVSAILLNKYGPGIANIAPEVLKMLQGA